MANTKTDGKVAAKAPTGLQVEGRKFWRSIATKYELRPDELMTLEQACKTIDLIGAMEREQEGQPATAKGSMGQEVIAPRLDLIRHNRTLLNTLIKSLKLPADDAGTQQAMQSRSDAARAAARARWSKPNLRAV